VLIAFEGIDCTGKTTQINLLKEYLEANGKTVLVVKEPGGTSLGIKIRQLIMGDANNSKLAELALYLADRAENVCKNIKPWLDKNNGQESQYVVITDRFKDSTIAYQANGKQVLSPKAAAYLNDVFAPDIKPDIVFVLDMPISLMKDRLAARGNLDHFEQRDEAFFKRVQDHYRSLAGPDFDEYVHLWVANKSIEELHGEIKQALEDSPL